VVVSAAVITLCGFAAIAAGSPSPLLLGLAVSLLYYAWHWHRVHLESISPEAVAAARAAESAFSVVALLAVFLR